ncbi:MAG: M48 family metallopeptidase [Methanosarcinales archaeon]
MIRSWKPSKNPINRKIGDMEFSYHVEHRRVKYPRLEFRSRNELLVILPLNMPNEEEILMKKEDWILKKLRKINKNLKNVEKYKKEIEDKNLILGDFYKIKSRKGWYDIRVNEDQIEVSTPNKKLFSKYLKHWLKKELRNTLIPYLNRFSDELKVNYNKVFIRTQKTKWASCSSNRNLNFNLKLISLPKELIEYVVLHEIVHVKESNHNRNFWRVVEKYYPNYKEKEDLLTGFWFLIKENKLWKDIDVIQFE